MRSRRSRAALAAASAALLALAPGPGARAGDEPAPPPPAPPPDVRGVAVPFHSEAPEDWDPGPALDELPGHGVTHVALFVHLWQRDATSAAPARHPLRTPSDAALARAIRAARERGLEVALVPSVLLEQPGKGEWRGTIAPPSWPEWFAAYRRELARWARLAEAERVAILAVGSELSSTESQGAEWREVIRAARAAYSGHLTYAANWDHQRAVQVWSDLDSIGVSAYDPLAERADASADEVAAGWARARDRLCAWRRGQGYSQPFLLLEVGYTSQDGCAVRPWDYTRRAPVDLEEQRRCYAAFAAAWRGVPELRGAFFYEWWGEGGEGDIGYTPRGKPALGEMRAFFGAR